MEFTDCDTALPEPVSALCQSFLDVADSSAPGLMQGLYLHGSLCWGEFFASSDIDFVAVLAERPSTELLGVLAHVHEQVKTRHPGRTFDGFHCTVDDLRRSPASCPSLPVFYEGRFAVEGDVDVNPVTWHELAERGISVRGVPATEVGVVTDGSALRDFTRNNLDTYWRATAERLAADQRRDVGRSTWIAPWCVLGVARLHHLLSTGRLTSKSGAGRYILEHLPLEWHAVAREALRMREAPDAPSTYEDPERLGEDITDFVRWAVCDGLNPAAAR